MLIDTHCHLDFKDFDKDRDEAVKRAYDAGVQKIINVGCDMESSRRSIALAEKYDFIYASVGLHPHEANSQLLKQLSKPHSDSWNELEKLAEHPKVKAIGECGLEYYGVRCQVLGVKEKQKNIFKKQIELAIKLNKPLIIHCRDAHNDVLDILKSYFLGRKSKLNGVIHFFSGAPRQAREYLGMGFMISFTGVITFSRDYDEVVQSAPLEKILIETDTPFVAPIPYRGKRNEPSYVIEVAKKIAEIKNIPLEKVAEQTSENALKIFSL